MTMKPGIPIQIGGVLVDLLSAQPDEGVLGAIPVVRTGAEVPVARIEALIHLKLNAAALMSHFEELVERAQQESD